MCFYIKRLVVLVTIIVLIILAGITLNAVIGEDGIIFQAKDTKNMIENETTYDNEQLAALQNELKDNSIYSGIGIIPGTDGGGGSEGGENGSGGGNQGGNSNTGGNNGQGNNNTNTDPGGDTTPGQDAQTPVISVIEGEEIAASFYRSDVTVQIYTYDKTQKIRYILTTTVEEINNELYPSGLVKEIDISNGGTLTFTKDGEYTITAYAYDTKGNKSQAAVKWIKRETQTAPGSGVTVSVASGNKGLNDWFTSNITIRVLGTDTGSTSVTYRVTGTAYSAGTIGDYEYDPGVLDTGEIEIPNGTTFKIVIDGDFSIVAYTYDAGGIRLSTAETLTLKRDASRPIITLYKGEQEVGTGFRVSLAAVDLASDLATTERYNYRHKLATSMDYIDQMSQDTNKLYQGLEQDKTYDMYVVVKDIAGNIAASDVISKTALWISNTPTIADGGVEGARKYSSTDVDMSMTGQDGKNVKISKLTYQILGTTTSSGQMDNIHYEKGVALPETEYEIDNGKMIPIRVDGNWTIKVHTYDEDGIKVTTNTYEVTRDTVNPNPPTVEVASGTMGEATYYRSNIDVRLTSQDDTCYKKTTYVVTGTATGAGTIGGVSVTAGQTVNIGETEIGNGSTFTIAADGRWKVQGYTYDKAGRKSEIAGGIEVTRDMVNPVVNTPSVTSGTQGEASYYRSNVTVKMNGGSDVTSPIKKMTYRVTGTATGNGNIGGVAVTTNQVVDTGEVEIANNGTFEISADGKWTVTAYSYDYSGRQSSGSNLIFTRDTVAPEISNFIIAEFTYTKGTSGKTKGTVTASDAFSGLATNGTYQYYWGAVSKNTGTANNYTYTGVTINASNVPKVVVKDKAGNTSEKLGNQPEIINFPYLGNQHTLTVAIAGVYKLEVWGAQGGYQGDNYSSLNYGAGYGGYSVGDVTFNEGDKIYVSVGGQGKYSISDYDSNTNVQGYKTGGYNGGGNTQESYGAGGGGASHIATRAGLLSSLSSNKNSILIVAGGGGGGDYQNYIQEYYFPYVGHGGGFIGNDGYNTMNNEYNYSKGGTQAAGGNGGNNASYAPYIGTFGHGGSGLATAGGGGGGYYGGGGGYAANQFITQYRGFGAGGSGFLATKLTNKCMYTYSTTKTSNVVGTKTVSTKKVSATPTAKYAKQGNGYARITLVE